MDFADLEVNQGLQNKRTILVTTPNRKEDEGQFLQRINGGKPLNNEPIWEMIMDQEQATDAPEMKSVFIDKAPEGILGDWKADPPVDVIESNVGTPNGELASWLRDILDNVRKMTDEQFSQCLVEMGRAGSGKPQLTQQVAMLMIEERAKMKEEQKNNVKLQHQSGVSGQFLRLTPSLKSMFPGLGSKKGKK